ETHIGWKVGPSDCITINTDGSVLQPHSQAAAGGILRTYLGHPVSTFAANLGRCSIMRAELRAAEIELMIAWDKGYKKVHLQLDSLAAVQILSKADNTDHQHGSLACQFFEMILWDWEVSIEHIFRESNFLADSLAAKGHSFTFGTHFVESSNPAVAHWIAYDRMRWSRPRLVLRQL
ncbi:Putative ribonuclease H protein At1g65750, partial [Linum perenne]